MAQTIKIKNSNQALKVPVPGDLAWGEIALNYADGKIYYKKSDATIQSISGGDFASPGPIGGTTPAAGTFTTLIGGKDAANYGQLTGGATTKAVQFQTLGTDTNVSMAIQPKGTGAIDLAAGSSGVNISNGGTVTAITRTAQGASYTSVPTVAISAPTTAGGVQATAIFAIQPNTFSVVSGGTGYTLNDVLTSVGGTVGSQSTQLTATAVSAGVITAITVTRFGRYYALPSNPISVTGGTGSGATFNMLDATVATEYIITAAGSGYVEQPTVTFSNGGGSGAAAYATVGSGTIVKGLGSSLSFYTPGGETLRLVDAGAGTTPWVFTNGLQNNFSSTAKSLAPYIGDTVTTGITFATGMGTGSGIGSSQFRVGHTASAVNYVQVTGSATGAGASALGGILYTGSDSSPNMAISTKGVGYIAFAGNSSTSNQSLRIATSTAVNTGNLIQIQGTAAGVAPVISVISGTSGTDTNIDLALTPKGTGAVLINSILGLNAVTASTTATTADQVLATFDATLYRTVKFVIQANSNATNYSSTEILAIHNGTTASYTEYATVTIGTACAVYSVDYSSATIRLLAAPASATATTYKIAAQLTRI